jgi:hypothetical protein
MVINNIFGNNTGSKNINIDSSLVITNFTMTGQQQELTEMNLVSMNTLKPVQSASQLSEMSADITVATEASESSYDSDRRISFGGIQVREYERIVGDHPDTRIGVPLTIGWGYMEREMLPIDQYEADRVPKGNLRMSSITRKNILHNVFGVPEEELRAAEKEVQKIKKSRQRTNNQSKLGAKSESAFKGFRRSVRKILSAEAFIKGLSAAASNGMVMSMTPN